MTTACSRSRRRSVRFGPLEVEFDGRVLEPRPWTYRQSVWTADVACTAPPGPLLELYAGAGHIGLAAAVLADRRLVQIEADPVAARYAQANARRAGWGERTEIRVASVEDALGTDERFPLIVADPPYLPTEQVATWPQDPVAAIDGGADGLDQVRVCLDVVAAHLQPDGRALLQVAGPVQLDRVDALLASRPDALRVVDRIVVDDERAVGMIAPRRN